MLSIIVVTFNSINFIQPCLDSLLSQNCQDTETIVIDNGSVDGTVRLLKENYPQVRLIENSRNLGACHARNQGIGASQGEWVLTLDCDTVLSGNFIEGIKETTKKLPLEVGILQPKIIKSDRKRIYSAGIAVSFLKRFHDIAKNSLDGGKLHKPRYIFGACSASAVYRKQMLEEIKDAYGYFDERFFFLVEDVDLASRAQENGWRAFYCPKAECFHDGNSSLMDKKKRQYLCWRNRDFFLKKSNINKFQLAAISLIYDFPHTLYLFLTNPYIRAQLINKRHTPCFLKNNEDIINV